MENSELTYSQQYSMFFLSGFFYLTFSGMRDELYFFSIFLKILMQTIFKVFIEFVTILLLFYVFSFLVTRRRDLSSHQD